MTFSRLLTVSALLGALSVAPVLAQDARAAAVKARQAHMQLYAFNLGTLVGMARGKIGYDAAAASAAASNLGALAGMQIGSYWLPGTAMGEIEGSNALPAIWESGSDVGTKAEALAEAVAGLQNAAGESLESLQAAMGPVGQACGGCHKSYRHSDK